MLGDIKHINTYYQRFVNTMTSNGDYRVVERGVLPSGKRVHMLISKDDRFEQKLVNAKNTRYGLFLKSDALAIPANRYINELVYLGQAADDFPDNDQYVMASPIATSKGGSVQGLITCNPLTVGDHLISQAGLINEPSPEEEWNCIFQEQLKNGKKNPALKSNLSAPHRVCVKTIKMISPGEELLVCYGDDKDDPEDDKSYGRDYKTSCTDTKTREEVNSKQLEALTRNRERIQSTRSTKKRRLEQTKPARSTRSTTAAKRRTSARNTGIASKKQRTAVQPDDQKEKQPISPKKRKNKTNERVAGVNKKKKMD